MGPGGLSTMPGPAAATHGRKEEGTMHGGGFCVPHEEGGPRAFLFWPSAEGRQVSPAFS